MVFIDNKGNIHHIDYDRGPFRAKSFSKKERINKDGLVSYEKIELSKLQPCYDYLNDIIDTIESNNTLMSFFLMLLSSTWTWWSWQYPYGAALLAMVHRGINAHLFIVVGPNASLVDHQACLNCSTLRPSPTVNVLPACLRPKDFQKQHRASQNNQ